MEKTTTTTENVVIKITALDIREAFDLPDDALVEFKVPSGGDYSGMVLDINDWCPVCVSWTKTEET